MARDSIADARNRLSRLIDLALQGEHVVITRHGRPVVSLRPEGQQAGPWLRSISIG
jgi:antitoxin (DNA-binding transcriptional repressor) of toxin-antitoxin stability system